MFFFVILNKNEQNYEHYFKITCRKLMKELVEIDYLLERVMVVLLKLPGFLTHLVSHDCNSQLLMEEQTCLN